jgi:signal transduction histidine kinase/AmiR/NasT family two-component response regulator
LKKQYEPPQSGGDSQLTQELSWVMYAATPDLKSDGSVGGLLGALTDISHLKWSEQQHIRNAENAQRDKRRQEEFIDVTSHEMRNPLSAITQCADSVIASLEEANSTTDARALLEIVKINVDAAESILFCASHQRRIIDDVLTLGKLDSELLTICPAIFRPTELLDQAMQMFKTEFNVNMVEVLTAVDETAAVSGDSLVYGDSSRLMQILVNLLTNAIKFTKLQQTRKITLRHGSSRSAPSAELFGPGFEWHPTGKFRSDLIQAAEYGQGEVVYVYYAVADSGKGIPSDFLNKVFSKFEQADRRSHTHYGGSGLGLYISRELTEMQGGCIGIKSSDGIGSTFAFYTKARCLEMTAKTHATQSGRAGPAIQSRNLESIPATATLPKVPKYNILLVEDNLLNQKILAKQLEKAGCNVKISNNGGEAIDSVLHLYGEHMEYDTLLPESALAYFDCILMDWEMPVCDGLKATRRIRDLEVQLGKARNVIIGVTANARDEQIAMAIEAGMDTVVSKPFRFIELIKKIGELVTPKGIV